MEKFRVFIAVTPDDTVLDCVDLKVSELKGAITTRDIRWEARTKWHVTLRFLGDVPSAEIAALNSSLQARCSGFGAFTAHVQGLGAFPSLKRPRILWAGVSGGGEEFSQLHAAVTEATAPFSAEPDDKRFRPHLTIARIRSDQRSISTQISKAVEPAAGMDFGSWTVGYIETWRSVLQPGGSRYELLYRSALPI